MTKRPRPPGRPMRPTPGVPKAEFGDEARFEGVYSVLEDLLRLAHHLAPDEVGELHQARLQRVRVLERKSPTGTVQAQLEAEDLALQIYGRLWEAEPS